MPRSVAGVYTLPGGINPVVAGTTILSTWANPTLDDVAQGVTDSLDRSGRGAMLAQLKAIDGVVAAPGYTFSSELTTGMWRPGASILAWSLGGTEYLRLTTSGLTNVGAFIAPSGTAALPSYTFTGDLNTGWSAAVADTLVGSTNGVNRLQIGPNGNITVAAPSSGTAISVTGILSGVAQLWSNNGGTASLSAFLDNSIITFGSVGTTPFALATNGSSRLTITSAGNVTIALPSSGSTFVVNTLSATASGALFTNGSTRGIRIANQAALNTIEGVDQTGGGSYQPLAIGGSTLALAISNTDALTISANRNVTIAAPSSGDTATFGQIAGAFGARVTASLSGGQSSLGVYNTSNTASSDARLVISNGGASAGDAYVVFDTAGINDWAIGPDNSDSDTWKVDFSAAPSTSTNRFNVTTDGRIYGNAIHNNAGAVTGTTNQYFASGTYTPTITNQVNVGASSIPAAWKWIREGNVVHMVGAIAITPTAAAGTVTVCRITLPIASNFGTSYDGLGSMTNRTDLSNRAQAVNSNGATDDLSINFAANSTTPSDWVIVASYEVL